MGSGDSSGMKIVVFSLICMSFLVSLLEAKGKKFDYKSVIAPPIQKMGEPQMWEGLDGMNILVSSRDPMVQRHVRQGFALLHAQWDVEAYRHFAAALKRDPDCLIAYSGIVMSMLNPNHEWKKYKVRALNRLMTLCEAKAPKRKDDDAKEDDDEVEYLYPENERGYALAVASFVSKSYAEGANAFAALAEKYPNDIQLALLKPFLNRGRYSVFGRADDRQQAALKRLRELMKIHPQNPMVLNFYVMLQVEAPSNAVDQAKEVLPYAKRIVKLAGDEMPCWQMLLGFSALRAGDTELAKASYEKAAALYEKWRKANKVGISEADGLMRAYSFLSVIYYELGDEKSLQAVMKKMSEAKQARKNSGVYAEYEWNVQLMPAKMLFAKDDVKSIKAALKALPRMKGATKENALFNKMLKGYQAYGLARLYDLSGDTMKSQRMAGLLGKIIKEMRPMLGEASWHGYYPQFLIAHRTFKVLHNELAGLRGEKEGAGAINWYNDAIDLQLGASRSFPPSILYPMEYRLAKYYEKIGDIKMARETYAEAYKRMPYHLPSKRAYEKYKKMLE